MKTQLAQNFWREGLCWTIAVIIASISFSPDAGASSSLRLRMTPGSTSELLLSADLPDKDPQVQIYIQRFLTLGRVETEHALGRAQYYFPMIEPYLQEAHLPNALKYLPLVESTLLPGVTSPSGAAGIWQIMPSTADYFGLKITPALDERRDPHRSTQAAVSLLAMLHDQFCDWHLALAAYNCGPGRVRKAIRKAGTRNYDQLKAFLPLQTRNYISKFVAMAYVANHYDQYGLTPKYPADLSGPTQVLAIEGALNLEELAQQSGAPLKTLRKLNPSYLSNQLPPLKDQGRYLVYLPQEDVKNYYISLGKEEALQQADHSQYLGPPLTAASLPTFTPPSVIGTGYHQPDLPASPKRPRTLFSKYFIRRWPNGLA
ncbi:MAG: lytic transglycosylase domain-containing protein [Haliscomenobacter sp.]|nr:lytic transglycosylase domain-containing protein [Haliscomenobacter sp.]